jgi:hypothetical protein
VPVAAQELLWAQAVAVDQAVVVLTDPAVLVTLLLHLPRKVIPEEQVVGQVNLVEVEVEPMLLAVAEVLVEVAVVQANSG